ncbi:DUF3014 domain-containing protein [Psychrobium sp. nBUS_13]|uniref:DUF3014 domain-containing protein n=1 Tax=Psychrobium sp. nBUS_13 TaxID=3395319 RepID=UPI003EBC06AD
MQENQSSTETKAPMKIYAIGALILVSAVAGVIILNSETPAPPPATSIEVVEPKVIPVAEIEVEPTPAPIAEPAKVTEEKTVIPEAVTTELIEPEVEPEPEPLPTLDESDTLAIDKAKELSWLPTATNHLNNKDIVRNFVTFVDNASRGDLAAKFSPILSPSAKFSINEIEQEMYIDPESYERYTPYVDTINSLNVDMAIDALVFMAPLLDEAYMELGYEQGAFVGTLDLALGEMLQAPVIRNPIKVIAPSAMYKYADPQLEGLSDIQKLMLRMGPDNITKLRPKLQQIQGALEQLEKSTQN